LALNASDHHSRLNTMPKVLRRTLLILSLLIIFILSAAIIVAGLFEERIGQTLTEEINKQLTSEFTISDFELSLLKGFPSASAGLKDVRILDTREKVLLEAEEMAFRFSLLSLFGSKIKINSILIRDGGLNIYIDRRGHANYDITKPNEAPTEETESADLAIVLKEARLVNMEVFYARYPISNEPEYSLMTLRSPVIFLLPNSTWKVPPKFNLVISN